MPPGAMAPPPSTAAAHHRVIPGNFAELVRDLPQETLVAERDDLPVALRATELGDDLISKIWVDPCHAIKGLAIALLAAMMTCAWKLMTATPAASDSTTAAATRSPGSTWRRPRGSGSRTPRRA